MGILTGEGWGGSGEYYRGAQMMRQEIIKKVKRKNGGPEKVGYPGSLTFKRLTMGHSKWGGKDGWERGRE